MRHRTMPKRPPRARLMETGRKKNFMLSKRLEKQLRTASYQRRISEAAIVRAALTHYFAQTVRRRRKPPATRRTPGAAELA